MLYIREDSVSLSKEEIDILVEGMKPGGNKISGGSVDEIDIGILHLFNQGMVSLVRPDYGERSTRIVTGEAGLRALERVQFSGHMFDEENPLILPGKMSKWKKDVRERMHKLDLGPVTVDNWSDLNTDALIYCALVNMGFASKDLFTSKMNLLSTSKKNLSSKTAFYTSATVTATPLGKALVEISLLRYNDLAIRDWKEWQQKYQKTMHRYEIAEELKDVLQWSPTVSSENEAVIEWKLVTKNATNSLRKFSVVGSARYMPQNEDPYRQNRYRWKVWGMSGIQRGAEGYMISMAQAKQQAEVAYAYAHGIRLNKKL